MTLVNRVSLFFLIALGVTLITFSAVLYGLVHHLLWTRFEAESVAALRTIVAAVEVESDGVKWQPSDHTIRLGADTLIDPAGQSDIVGDELQWSVVDERGRVIDHSRDLEASAPKPDANWRILQQTLSAPAPKPLAERDPDEFASLTVTVMRSPAGLQANLRTLAFILCGLTGGVWLVAAAAGRQYCRRALGPVHEMAERTHSIGASDFQSRLPLSPHQDELTRLAVEFNALLDRLQESFERQRRFTGDAAHQLRTPLTVLLGQIEVALRRPRSAEDYAGTLSLLQEQTLELQELVESLLFLAQVDEDPMLVIRRRGSLKCWLLEQAVRWRDRPRGADLVVDIDTKIDTEVELTTSWTMLGQILDNLVDNALKYGPPGTPVRLHAVPNGNAVVFTVDDAGPGIPDSERGAIFEPFFRSPSARQSGAPGTGLGLAIAARIARLLDGTLTQENLSPQGCRFRFELRRIAPGDSRYPRRIGSIADCVTPRTGVPDAQTDLSRPMTAF